MQLEVPLSGRCAISLSACIGFAKLVLKADCMYQLDTTPRLGRHVDEITKWQVVNSMHDKLQASNKTTLG